MSNLGLVSAYEAFPENKRNALAGERPRLSLPCVRRYPHIKLNHVNLAVTDLESAANFLETYFGLRRQFNNQGIIVLNDDDLLICTLTKAAQVNYPGSFHIGFVQESKQRVDEIYQRLKDDGFEIKSPQQAHAWTFYVQAPGGFTVEVLAL